MNTLGEPLDGKGPIQSDVAYPVEKLAPGIIRRQSVNQPVQTGIMPIDAMIPIGRGQRELIIGDRSTGKTTICVDTIISQARSEPGGRSGRRQGLPSAVLHLRGHRSEAVQHRPADRHSRRSRGHALHDHCRRSGCRLGHQPVPGALCGHGDGRVVYGQRHGCADRLRRLVQARRGLPAGLAGPQAPVGPRGLSGRRVLSAQPIARTGGPRRREVWQRFAHGAADHRDAGGRRVRLHSHQRHLDHGRSDLSGIGLVLPGRSSRRSRWASPSPVSVPRPRSRR